MNDFIKKKLNLLTHLANVDGKFHKSEKALIKTIAEQAGLDQHEFHLLESTGNAMDDIGAVDDKYEMLYLALKLMQADNKVREEEIVFCEELARKLNYNPEVSRYYAFQKLPSREEFDREVTRWMIRSK